MDMLNSTQPCPKNVLSENFDSPIAYQVHFMLPCMLIYKVIPQIFQKKKTI